VESICDICIKYCAVEKRLSRGSHKPKIVSSNLTGRNDGVVQATKNVSLGINWQYMPSVKNEALITGTEAIPLNRVALFYLWKILFTLVLMIATLFVILYAAVVFLLMWLCVAGEGDYVE
jgi:hypothetical protein